MFDFVAASTPTDELTDAAVLKSTEWWSELGSMIITPVIAFTILFIWAAIFWPSLTYIGSKVLSTKPAGPFDFIKKYYKGALVMAVASPFMFIPNAFLNLYG